MIIRDDNRPEQAERARAANAYRHYTRSYTAGSVFLLIPPMAGTGFLIMMLVQSMPAYLILLGGMATASLATAGLGVLFQQLEKKYPERRHLKKTKKIFFNLSKISGFVAATLGLGFLAGISAMIQPWALIGASFGSLGLGSALSIHASAYYRRHCARRPVRVTPINPGGDASFFLNPTFTPQFRESIAQSVEQRPALKSALKTGDTPQVKKSVRWAPTITKL